MPASQYQWTMSKHMATNDSVTPLPVQKPRLVSDNQVSGVTRFVKQSLKPGEVALVGAGPGDPELLTIKALNCLQQADVVLYDYLVSEEIMALIPSDTILVCVGKRAGHHSVPQEKTNQLLVDFAKQGYRVVRVKGGDPFVFGRGGEELEVLADAGIRFQVVPGITAAAGATAHAGIPLTHRDYAQSAIFVTGHLKEESDEMDWSTLARGNQTLVIYMGLMKSHYIQNQLIQHGRAASTPIAIIERGTQIQQKVFTGELSQLSDLSKEAQAPSLIVVGEVVRLSQKLDWFLSSTDFNKSAIANSI
ncbi:uroporphyrinogen-III C-methyltransferase [Vibrio parahaemolyticus]|nr:uroporphyrinogen-III C-methyltransferase [Vibrio parahaemolyticus]